MPRGKKTCPECNTELGVRTSTCPECSYNFSSPQEENGGNENGSSKEVMSKTTRELMEHIALNPPQPVEHLTPDEHADRILGYGKERARNLMKQHQSNGGWGHVNWKKVEEALGA